MTMSSFCQYTPQVGFVQTWMAFHWSTDNWIDDLPLDLSRVVVAEIPWWCWCWWWDPIAVTATKSAVDDIVALETVPVLEEGFVFVPWRLLWLDPDTDAVAVGRKTTIFWPSSRRQTILGAGLPVAVHVSVTLSPSLTVTSLVLRSSTMSGGTWTWMQPSCFFIIAVLIFDSK